MLVVGVIRGAHMRDRMIWWRGRAVDGERLELGWSRMRRFKGKVAKRVGVAGAIRIPVPTVVVAVEILVLVVVACPRTVIVETRPLPKAIVRNTLWRGRERGCIIRREWHGQRHVRHLTALLLLLLLLLITSLSRIPIPSAEMLIDEPVLPVVPRRIPLIRDPSQQGDQVGQTGRRCGARRGCQVVSRRNGRVASVVVAAVTLVHSQLRTTPVVLLTRPGVIPAIVIAIRIVSRRRQLRCQQRLLVQPMQIRLNLADVHIAISKLIPTVRTRGRVVPRRGEMPELVPTTPNPSMQSPQHGNIQRSSQQGRPRRTSSPSPERHVGRRCHHPSETRRPRPQPQTRPRLGRPRQIPPPTVIIIIGRLIPIHQITQQLVPMRLVDLFVRGRVDPSCSRGLLSSKPITFLFRLDPFGHGHTSFLEGFPTTCWA